MTDQPDIVEQLRSGVSGPHKQGVKYNISVTLKPETVFQAADEIKRLRKRIDYLESSSISDVVTLDEMQQRAEAAEDMIDIARMYAMDGSQLRRFIEKYDKAAK